MPFASSEELSETFRATKEKWIFQSNKSSQAHHTFVHFKDIRAIFKVPTTS